MEENTIKIYNEKGEFIGERRIGTTFSSITGLNEKEFEKYKFGELKSPNVETLIYRSV
jgi:hypothetical protein